MPKVKQKRTNKSKEQLIAELKANTKFQEKMAFTRDLFYPALCQATTSIDDALQNLSIINSVMMEKFLSIMKEKTFGELNMHHNLDPKDPKHDDIKEMLDLFKGMSIFDAKDLMEGMRNEINLFLTEENKVRTLAEVRTKWIDEL